MNRYLNLFLSTRAKQKPSKVKTQNVLTLTIGDPCRLEFINWDKEIATFT